MFFTRHFSHRIGNDGRTSRVHARRQSPRSKPSLETVESRQLLATAIEFGLIAANMAAQAGRTSAVVAELPELTETSIQAITTTSGDFSQRTGLAVTDTSPITLAILGQQGDAANASTAPGAAILGQQVTTLDVSPSQRVPGSPQTVDYGIESGAGAPSVSVPAESPVAPISAIVSSQPAVADSPSARARA